MKSVSLNDKVKLSEKGDTGEIVGIIHENLYTNDGVRSFFEYLGYGYVVFTEHGYIVLEEIDEDIILL